MGWRGSPPGKKEGPWVWDTRREGGRGRSRRGEEKRQAEKIKMINLAVVKSAGILPIVQYEKKSKILGYLGFPPVLHEKYTPCQAPIFFAFISSPRREEIARSRYMAKGLAFRRSKSKSHPTSISSSVSVFNQGGTKIRPNKSYIDIYVVLLY